MIISVNGIYFEMPWSKSTTMNGWEEFRAWFEKALDEGYQYEEDDNEPSGYPIVEVETSGLPQLLVIGVCYGSDLQFGNVLSDGTFRALWYCAPSMERFYKFLDSLRIAEHQFEGAKYSFGSPRWSEEE